MKNDGITYKTDLFRYDKSKSEWTKRKDYDIISSFKFSGNEFFLLKKCGVFFIAISVNGNLMSLYYVLENDNGSKIFPGEAVSTFRKLYAKNGVTQQMLDDFLSDPVGYRSRTK